MKHLTFSCQALCAVVLVLLFSALADAQMVRPRKPSEPVTQPAEEPYKPLPTPTERATMVESVIRDVRVVPSARSVTISFRAFPNTAPLVELGKVQPKVGADGRWGFPPDSGSVTRPAGGDKAKGEYTVDMNQQLEPGATYYYIISAQSDDSPNARRDQATDQFSSNPSTFLVRYRGFICQETTDGPGSDEIYAIVSASYIDTWTGRTTSTGRHPHVTVKDVGNGDVHGDSGRNIYQGGARNLLLTVTLMEHDEGDPHEYTDAVDHTVIGAFARLAISYPQLLLAGPELGEAMLDISDAVRGALGPGDDVIGTVTRLITEEEMKSMANQPSSDEQGILYNFFTEHHGYGGIYRVYFEIIPN